MSEYELMQHKKAAEQDRSERLAMSWTSLKEWAEYLRDHKKWYQDDDIARVLDDERGYALRIAGLNNCSEAMAVLEKTGEKSKVLDIDFKLMSTYYLYIVIKK